MGLPGHILVHKTKPGQQQRVRVSVFAEGQDAGPSRANHWRVLGAVSAYLAGLQVVRT